MFRYNARLWSDDGRLYTVMKSLSCFLSYMFWNSRCSLALSLDARCQRRETVYTVELEGGPTLPSRFLGSDDEAQ